MEPVKDNNLDYTMNILENALSLLLGADVAVNDMSFDVDTDEGTCDIRISADVDGDDLACDCDNDDDDEEVCDGDCDNCVYADCDDDDVPCLGIPPIDNIIFNPPATIVLWCDGTKTVVKCMEGQPFERYAGFSAAVMKKLFGSTSRAKRVMECCAQDQEEPKPEPEPKKQTATTKRHDVSEDSDLADFKKDVTDELATKVAGLILAILGFHNPTEEKE